MHEPRSDEPRPARSTRTAPASPGVRIRQYEIVSEIGRGGMGVVYRARDLELGRFVALKSPWRELATEANTRKRFLHEARATSRLSHPSVVPIYAAFEEAGAPWIVLRLIDGQDLRRIVEKAGSRDGHNIIEVVRWGEQLAEALEAAHGQHILHRDVTPRNILVDDQNRALLTDFGLARSFPVGPDGSTQSMDPTSVTSEGSIVGTPRYMSPEQVLGQDLDGRSDLFSLAVVLYEVTTGAPAFPSGQLGEVFNAITSREPSPLRRFSYEIPEEWERILLKCLRKNRDDRYPDARSLVVDLRTFQRDLEFREYSSSGSQSPAPSSRRWPSPAVSWLALAAVATITFIVAWILVSRKEPVIIPVGSPIQVTAGEAWDHDPSLSPDGTRIAFASDRDGGSDIYVVDARGGAVLRLTDTEGEESKPIWDSSGHYVLYVSNRGRGPSIWKVGQMGGSPTLVLEDATDPALSPDGAELAFASAGTDGLPQIGVASYANSSKVRILTTSEHGLWRHDPCWSSDGSKIVYAEIDNLWMVPARGGEPKPMTRSGAGDTDPIFHPRGHGVVFSSRREGTSALWHVAGSGGEARRLTLGSSQEAHPTFSRDGQRLAYATESGTYGVILHNTRSGREVQLEGAEDDLMPTLSPDGSALVFSSSRWGSTRDLWKQSLRDGDPVDAPQRLTDLPGHASHPMYSPDGNWIVFYRILDADRDVWIVSADGGTPHQVTEDLHSDIHPAWSPDGKTLIWVSDRKDGSQIWSIGVTQGQPSGDPAPLTAVDCGPHAPSWSPDGRHIVFTGTRDGQDEVWSLSVPDGDLRQLTTGANALRARYDASGRIWVAGSWGRDRLSCRILDPETNQPSDETVALGSLDAPPMFDVSVEPPLLAFSRETPRGSIWLIDGR